MSSFKGYFIKKYIQNFGEKINFYRKLKKTLVYLRIKESFLKNSIFIEIC